MNPGEQISELEWEDDVESMTKEELVVEVRMVRELAKEHYAKAADAYARGLNDNANCLPDPVAPTNEDYRDPMKIIEHMLGYMTRHAKRDEDNYRPTYLSLRRETDPWKRGPIRKRLDALSTRLHEMNCAIGFLQSLVSARKRQLEQKGPLP